MNDAKKLYNALLNLLENIYEMPERNYMALGIQRAIEYILKEYKHIEKEDNNER